MSIAKQANDQSLKQVVLAHDYSLHFRDQRLKWFGSNDYLAFDFLNVDIVGLSHDYFLRFDCVELRWLLELVRRMRLVHCDNY